MTFPERATFVFLVITWGDGGEDERETFGPYIAQQDGSHLDLIQGRAEAWRAEHPDMPHMAVHLFATSLVPPGDKPKPKVQLNITSPPPASVAHVPVLPEEWLRRR